MLRAPLLSAVHIRFSETFVCAKLIERVAPHRVNGWSRNGLPFAGLMLVAPSSNHTRGAVLPKGLKNASISHQSSGHPGHLALKDTSREDRRSQP
jgi:hypothetical protein